MRPVPVLALAGSLLWGGATLAEPGIRRGGVETDELFYYPSGKFVREAAIGFEQAGAAIGWLTTVQYYGEHKRTDGIFDKMFHLCDVVTDLDPRFEEPYLFGSFVLLAEGKSPEDGLKLLEKGRTLHPESWRLQFESGFVAYICYHDYATAGRYFRAAAALPGAPPYAASFAAYMAQKSGSPEAALLLWTEFAGRTDNPALKERAAEKVAELKAQMESDPAGGENRE